MRVHELAKKHSMSSKELMDILDKLKIGITGKHLSVLNADDIKKVEEYLVKGKKDDIATNSEKEIKKEVVKLKKTDIKKVHTNDENSEINSDEHIKNNKTNKHKKNFNLENTNSLNNNSKHNNKSKDHPKKNKKDNILKEKVVNEVVVEDIKVIKMCEELTVKELADKMKINSSELLKKLFLKGKVLNINSILNCEEVEEIAIEYEYLVEQEEILEETYGEKFNLEEVDTEENLEERPPVITIMGHVDHGKTSLLDAIRKTSVTQGEAGGITQKIGAYQVNKDGKKITFIDTPGHEAFTEMRVRGAKVTDIAILVVAADDGVMSQTVEAISHAKEANVPIIVAVNKIDKPGADVMRIKQELTEYNLVPVDWGGDTEFVEVSAKKLLNLDNLLETILLTAEIQELKANPNKRAKGVVLESRLDPQIGPVAYLLVQEGSLHIGDPFVVGETYGKVRAMLDDRGVKRQQVTMSEPIEITGFNSVPEAGDVFYAIKNEKQCKKIVEEVIKDKKIKELNKRKHISLDELHQRLEDEKLKELKIILKGDSKGSVEALKDMLNKISNEEVKVNIIHSSPGAVTEGDIKLAGASDAIVIAFNVRPTTKARYEAEKENIEIRTYNVVYHVTKDIEEAVKGMLSPIFKEVYQGRAEIRKIFKMTKIGNIGGSFVIDGRIKKNSQIRVLRNGIIIHEGELNSLKRYNDDANEVIVGLECGITIDNYNDIKEGDIIESFIMEEIER